MVREWEGAERLGGEISWLRTGRKARPFAASRYDDTPRSPFIILPRRIIDLSFSLSLSIFVLFPWPALILASGTSRAYIPLPRIHKLADQDLRRDSLPRDSPSRDPPSRDLLSHDPPSHDHSSHDPPPHDHSSQHIHFAPQDAPPEHGHGDQLGLASTPLKHPPRATVRRLSSTPNIHADASNPPASPDANNVVANAGFVATPAKPMMRRAMTYQTGDTGAGFGSLGSEPLSPSVDAWSEFEVVLDDGTRQRRAVSLSSTVHDQDGENEDEEDEQRGRRTRDEGVGEELDFGPDDPEHGTFTFTQEHPSGSSSSPNDSDSDSDDLLYSNQPHRRHRRHASNTPRTLRSILYNSFPHLSNAQKLVLKCSIAYSLASLFTFVPQLNALIGNNKVSSHIIATATVFFNPAKTVGGMVEAAGYGWAYTLFAIAVCFGSMASTVWLVQQGLETIAHIVSLVVWLGGSTFIVAFLKASWNKPPVATASSLCFIIMFVVLVREGSTNMGDFDTIRIQQMASAVVVGTIITVLVCVIVWPSMAGRKLKTDIADTLTSFRILLKLLTKTFLLDADLPQFTSNTALAKAIISHRATFTSLQKSLHETRLEFMDRSMASHLDEYEDTVKSLQRLAQHVGGLRSSCGLQFELLHHSTGRHSSVPNTPPEPQRGSRSTPLRTSVGHSMRRMARAGEARRRETWSFRPGHLRRAMDNQIAREQSTRRSGPNSATSPRSSTFLTGKAATSPKEMDGEESDENEDGPGALVEFIETVGPPMRSLAYTCKRTLVQLQEQVTHDSVQGLGSFYGSFTSWTSPNMTAEETSLLGGEGEGSNRGHAPVSFKLLQRNLKAALELFETSHRQAIARLYRRKMKLHRVRARLLAESGAGVLPDDEEGPSEEIFVVYLFVFCLQEFAKELGVLVDCIRRVCEDEEEEEEEEEQEGRGGWWGWVTGWCGRKNVSREEEEEEEETERVRDQQRKRKMKRSNSMWGGNPNNEGAKPPRPAMTTSTANPSAAFFSNDRNTANTLHTPAPTSRWHSFFLQLWSFFSWFRRFSVRYAFKATVAALILATPAFVDTWQDWFLEYRMEWGLITLMVVMTPTIGGTNLVAVYRILSTVVGCYTAAAIYTVFPANIIVLPIFTFIFSIPNFYIILNSVHGKMGQFTLLAYNLVMLSGYNYREDPTFDIVYLAWRRAIAVVIGVLFGVLVTNYVWPYEARVELRKGLSDLLLNLAWLYNKLVTLNSNLGLMPNTPTPDDVSDFFFAQSPANTDFLDTELALQLNLLQLHDLLNQTPNEPRLKGPFPVESYSHMLTSAQNILDKLLSMRIAILDEGWHSEVRRNFIVPLNKERREVAGNVLLYFYTLASALKLKTPLPPYLPPAMQAWKRQLERLRELPVVNAKALVEGDEHYMFYYAFLVMLEEVVSELDKIGSKMKDLFGELMPSAEWEQHFVALPEDEVAARAGER